MAAGEYRMRIEKFLIVPGKHVVVEFRHGVVDTAGDVDARNSTLQLTWPQYLAIASASERSSFASFAEKLKEQIRAGIPKLSTATDLVEEV